MGQPFWLKKLVAMFRKIVFLLQIISFAQSLPTHVERQGNENQQRDEGLEYESVFPLPTVNVYYKFPSQKNDLSRKIREVEDHSSLRSRITNLLSRSQNKDILAISHDVSEQLRSLSNLISGNKKS